MEINKKLLYNEVSPKLDNKPYKPGDWQKIPEIIHSDQEIKGFFGDFRFLSNFSEAIIYLDGVEYPSVELAYQAAKWQKSNRDFFTICNNEDAIIYNRNNQPDGYSPEEWETVKLEVMRFLLEQKFNNEQNPDNYEKIIKTGNKYLEETNWWNDTFWGKNLEGEGDNHLGSILMDIRNQQKDDC